MVFWHAFRWQALPGHFFPGPSPNPKGNAQVRSPVSCVALKVSSICQSPDLDPIAVFFPRELLQSETVPLVSVRLLPSFLSPPSFTLLVATFPRPNARHPPGNSAFVRLLIRVIAPRLRKIPKHQEVRKRTERT